MLVANRKKTTDQLQTEIRALTKQHAKDPKATGSPVVHYVEDPDLAKMEQMCP
jgi:hypothetical protein